VDYVPVDLSRFSIPSLTNPFSNWEKPEYILGAFTMIAIFLIPVFFYIRMFIDAIKKSGKYDDENDDLLLVVFYKDKREAIIKFLIRRFVKYTGPENAVIEINLIEKIVQYIIPLVIFLTIVTTLNLYWDIPELKNHIARFVDVEKFYKTTYILGNYLAVSIYFYMIVISKTFNYYFAKICSGVITGKTPREEKAKYFTIAIESYNKFLKKRLKIKLNEIKLYSKFFTEDWIQETCFYNSFEQKDKLKPLRYLSTYFNNMEDILMKENSFEKIRDWISPLIALITIIFTILNILMPNTFPRL
jgi:hypothetical protein